MKHFYLICFLILLASCSSNKKVFWCGDHACINNAEKEEYFKKTMIVEVKNIKSTKIKKTEFEVIKEKIGLKESRAIAKQLKIEKKRRLKEEKKLAKLKRTEDRKIKKNEKKLEKEARIKEDKTNSKPIIKTSKNLSENIIIASSEFDELKKKIIEKNMSRSYPDINDIPN